MWNWLIQQQMTVAEELVWGLVLLVAGLYLEDWIDRWRGRKRNGTGTGS